MSRERFDELLERVLASLPEDVRRLLDEVAIIVEDEPSSALLQDMGIRTSRQLSDLCGLHSGIPMTERSVFEGAGTPTTIHLFRGPIARLAEDGGNGELERQIRITLLHEIGHSLGLEHDRLKELGYL